MEGWQTGLHRHFLWQFGVKQYEACLLQGNQLADTVKHPL